MLINYCDLCGVALKEDDFYSIHTVSAKDANIKDLTEYYAALNKAQENVQDICPNCKILMDQIFKLRFQNLSQINQELLGIYSLPTFNPKEKKNGKEKK